MKKTYLSKLPLRLFKKNSHQKSTSFTISFLLLLAFFQAFLIHETYAPPPPTTRIVPSDDYPTIQSAIDVSSRGDIVQVNPGTYYEHLIVDVVNLKLIGTNKYTTIIDGDASGTPITLEADGITVTGFTITNLGNHDWGIKSSNYGGHNITDNIIQNMTDGVYFLQSDSNIIVGNTFFNNSMHAINIGSSLDNQITDNIISESAYGIYLMSTNSTTVLRNNISETAFGIYSGQTTLNNISNNTEQSNSCGIQAQSSDSLTIDNNAITGGMYAILLQEISDSTLANNTLTQASYGVYFVYSNYNTFGGTRGNLVNKNDWGIIVYNGTGNQIIDGNTIAQNTWGISMVSYANGNTIYHNNFYSNVRQAYQEIYSFENLWWNTNSLEGNYWNDYQGYPPAGGVDYYPLAQPWPMRNLATTSVTVSKTLAYQGNIITISVTVKNFGVITETFKVTTYANSIPIGTQFTTLTPDSITTLTYQWNTTNVTPNYYVISATAGPIPYVERNYADNTLTDGTVQVRIPGDVNGDGIVNIGDVGVISAHWYPGPPIGPLDYDPTVDINSDGAINIAEVGIVSAYWTGPPKGPLAP